MFWKRIGKRYLAIVMTLIMVLSGLWTGGWMETVHADAGDPFYIGNAIHFADSNDTLYTSAPLTNQLDNITMEAWVKADTFSDTNTNIRIMYNGNSSFSGYGIYLSGANKTPCILVGCVAFVSPVEPVTLNTGEWYHLAAVRDSGIWKLYVNGKEEAVSPGYAPPNPILPNPVYVPPGLSYNNDFSVGNSEYMEGFKGCIDEVRFWNVARSSDDIRNNMYVKLQGDEPGLMAYYNFDQEGIVPDGDNSGITSVEDLAVDPVGGEQDLPIAGFTLNGDTSNFVPSVQLGQFQLESASYDIKESAGSVKVAVTRTGGSEGEVAIHYAAADGTASDGTNYTAVNGDVTFAGGETRKEIDIPVLNAGITETKSFSIALTAPQGVSLGANSSATVNIEPNDAKAITAFDFDALEPAVTGVVDEAAGTVALTVPYGTEVAALVPSIEHTGLSILPESGAAEDFTNQVKYTVTAADGSTKDYWVTVTVSPPEFAGGDGSAEAPYQITKLEHLNNMRNYPGKYFELMKDLDFNLDTDYRDTANKADWTTGAGWIPVGTDASRFTGSFNGNGHTITGLMTNQTESYTGLFGYIAGGAEVKNIILKDVNVTGRAYVGGLAGQNDGSVTNSGVSGSVKGYSYTGGLAGRNDGTVSLCHSGAEVSLSEAGTNSYFGGLAGYSGAGSNINGSYATGEVALSNSSGSCTYIGGLAGKLEGTAETPATITNSYSTGAVGDGDTEGGLVGGASYAVISNCYSAGNVTGTGTKGGLIAEADTSTITSAYYNSAAAGCGDNGTGTPEAPAAMRTAGTFADWDFDTVWAITDTGGGCSYPYLRNNAQDPAPGYTEKVVISTSPQAAAVIAGENASFTVAATGTGLTYQWQVDTGTGFGDIDDGGVYSGTETAVLSITGADTGMNGYAYRAIVTGTEAPAATSDSAVLTVGLLSGHLLQSVAAGDGYAVINWAPVAEATGYEIFSSTEPGVYGTPEATVDDSVCNHRIEGLTNGTTYYFVVRILIGSVESEDSNQMSAIPQVAAPGAPVLQSAVSGDHSVALTWDPVSGSTGYKIFSGISAGSYGEPVATVTAEVYSYNVTELANGTACYFVVSATNPGGDSGYSNEMSATPVSVPGMPTEVTAEAGSGQATVSFNAPEDNGGSPITGYIVTSEPGGITAAGTGTSITVTGLSNGTAYTFTVKAVNAIGNSEQSGASDTVTPHRPPRDNDPGSDREEAPTPASAPAPAPIPNTTPDEGTVILVNGNAETAAESKTITTGEQTVTTVAIDDEKVEEKLQAEGNNAVVTIPVMNSADIVESQLNGQTVKDMEAKEAVLEIRTGNVTYTLPAAQINIDDVSAQIGEQVKLKDIKVKVSISAPPQDTARIVEATANKNNYQVVVKPIDFNITCENGNKTVGVSKFNGYVERMVAIPEGVDPGRITTGIVLNADGTFSHVPTTIIAIDGKYYARINSLTNSTYSVIWNPIAFEDLKNHWAGAAVNDMGSRLVMEGNGKDRFDPDNTISRAEFAEVIVRALGLMRSGTGKDTFSDVPKADHYYDAVSIAYEYGIISGCGNHEFRPADKVTREQAMLMIARAMGIAGLKTELTGNEVNKLLESFTDAGTMSADTRNSIAMSIKAGIITGRNGKLLAPKADVTRAETAVMVRRLLQAAGLI